MFPGTALPFRRLPILENISFALFSTPPPIIHRNCVAQFEQPILPGQFCRSVGHSLFTLSLSLSAMCTNSVNWIEVSESAYGLQVESIVRSRLRFCRVVGQLVYVYFLCVHVHVCISQKGVLKPNMRCTNSICNSTHLLCTCTHMCTCAVLTSLHYKQHMMMYSSFAIKPMTMWHRGAEQRTDAQVRPRIFDVHRAQRAFVVFNVKCIYTHSKTLTLELGECIVHYCNLPKYNQN